MPVASHPFRFGVVAAQAASGVEWKTLASRVEAAGYSTLLIPDGAGPLLSPLTALATAAACTSTLHVGSWVLANDLRNPVLLAREAATLDLLSDGRLELGLGPGRADNDYPALGLPPAGSGGERLSRLEEAVRIIRDLWRGEPVTFQGEHYTLANATLYPTPRHELPLLMAAAQPKALRLAGRYADTVALGSHTPELVEQQRQILAEAAGDRFEQIELASLVYVLAEGDQAARQMAAAMAGRLGGADLDDLIARGSPNVVVGSHEAMIEQLRERRARLGLSYVAVMVTSAASFEPVVRRLAGT